jgi:hypothetical protein
MRKIIWQIIQISEKHLGIPVQKLFYMYIPVDVKYLAHYQFQGTNNKINRHI